MAYKVGAPCLILESIKARNNRSRLAKGKERPALGAVHVIIVNRRMDTKTHALGGQSSTNVSIGDVGLGLEGRGVDTGCEEDPFVGGGRGGRCSCGEGGSRHKDRYNRHNDGGKAHDEPQWVRAHGTLSSIPCWLLTKEEERDEKRRKKDVNG